MSCEYLWNVHWIYGFWVIQIYIFVIRDQITKLLSVSEIFSNFCARNTNLIFESSDLNHIFYFYCNLQKDIVSKNFVYYSHKTSSFIAEIKTNVLSLVEFYETEFCSQSLNNNKMPEFLNVSQNDFFICIQSYCFYKGYHVNNKSVFVLLLGFLHWK